MRRYLPSVQGHVANWEFKARRNGHIRLAKLLSFIDVDRKKRD